MKKELEIYIHIPFCIKKCAYCDFLSSNQSEEIRSQYVQALIREIRTYDKKYHGYGVTTVFFGGGTPSILEGEQIQDVFVALREVFNIAEDAEISMEANPGTVTREKLNAYKQAGVNRISFGLQSANNEELQLLGRIHTFEEFLESYQMARECGFENINVDLISAIPGQTLTRWEKTLRTVMKLEPEHISSYSLIIEEGTPFAKQYGERTKGARKLPSEEEERRIYRRTEELLAEAGYHHYEISNYAKEGKECRHNLGYWERKNYLGIGLGASSLIENTRYNHKDNLKEYIEHSEELEKIQTMTEVLTLDEQMEEFVFLGMRKMNGIVKEEFAQLFGKTIDECYGNNIERLKGQGLLIDEKGYLRLSKQGIDISNYVFAEMLYK